MTSIRGVMLISLRGAGPVVRSRRPNAMGVKPQFQKRDGGPPHRSLRPDPAAFPADRGRSPRARLRTPPPTCQSYGQARCRHDQCLADRPGHLVDRHGSRRSNPHQGVVDAPNRSEKADERRGTADGRQQHLTKIQDFQDAMEGIAQAAGQLGRAVALGFQRRPLRLGQGGIDDRRHEPFSVQGFELCTGSLQAIRSPKGGHRPDNIPANALEQPGLPKNHHPGAD